MLNRIAVLWIIYAAIVGFVVGASLFSPPIRPQNNATIERGNGGTKNGVPNITAPESADERIASYTWWLAAFTFALVIVSAVQIHFLLRADDTAQSLARTASRQAMAAVNSERPFVYISDMELRRLPAYEKNGDKVMKAFFTFTNYGRTPAFVTCIGYGQALVKELPPEPKYSYVKDISVEIVIRPDKPFQFEIPYALFVMTPQQQQEIQRAETFPWLWGCIRYRDFMNGEGESGFVAFQYPEMTAGDHILMPATFRWRGPKAYTYQRYSENGLPPIEG